MEMVWFQVILPLVALFPYHNPKPNLVFTLDLDHEINWYHICPIYYHVITVMFYQKFRLSVMVIWDSLK